MFPNVTQYIDMASGTLGNTLTTTIMSNSTHGTVSGWTMNPATPTGLTVAARQILQPDGVGIAKIGGYAHGNSERAIAIDHTNASMTAEMDFPSTAIRASLGCFINLGPTNAGASPVLFDYIVMRDGFSGDSITLQLSNGTDYTLNIEANSGGTFHSANIRVARLTWYWVTMLWDMQAGQGRALLCHPTTFQVLGVMQVRCTKAAIGSGGLGEIRFGNNETGTSAGTTSYLQHIMVDTQRAQFPLLPRILPDVRMPMWMKVAAGGRTAKNTRAFPLGMEIGMNWRGQI